MITSKETKYAQECKTEFIDPVMLREYITCPKCGKKMIVYLMKTGEAKTIHKCGIPFDYIAGLGEIII